MTSIRLSVLDQSVSLAGSSEDAAIRAWARDAGLAARELPPFACAASEDELGRAARTPGITFGSHTWGHPNLARLAEHELGRRTTDTEILGGAVASLGAVVFALLFAAGTAWGRRTRWNNLQGRCFRKLSA